MDSAPGVPKRPRFLRVFGILLLIILIAAGAAYWYRAPLLKAASLAMVPAELKDARFVVIKDRKVTTYARDGFTLIEEPTVDPEVIARLQEVRPGTGKVAPTISPDGTQLAFAEAPENREVRDHDSWNVILVSAGTTTRVAGGYAPFFTSDGNLGWFTNAGIVIRDRATGQQVLAHAQVFQNVLIALRQSPDRSLIAWTEPDLKTVRVFRVRGNSIGSIARYTDLATAYALGNDAVYTVTPGWLGSEVLRYELVNGASGTRIHWFPSSLTITAIML